MSFVLRHDRKTHRRLAEVLRAITVFGPVSRTARPYQTEFMIELARRGALDREVHFERFKGDVMATWAANQLLKGTLTEGVDRGLIERVDGQRGVYRIMDEGLAVLRHYDSTSDDANIRPTGDVVARPIANPGGVISVGRVLTRKVD